MGVSLAVQRGSALYCTFTNSRKLPNLTISKTPNNETINAGEDAEFTIVVANTGTGTARDVVLTDTLPAQGTWTISEDPGGCSIAAGVLTCDFGDLAAGASRTVKILARTSFQQCATYVNGATVSTSTEDSVDDNGNVITCLRPNLTVTKTPDDLVIDAGEDAEFSIVIGNSGDGVAKNVTLSDQLPAPGVGGWVVSQQPSQGTCTVSGSNLLTCTGLGNLAKGQSRTVMVKTGTSNAACAVYDNPAATARASNHPPVSDDGKITCRPDATVTVIKNAVPKDGTDFEYTTTLGSGANFKLDNDGALESPAAKAEFAAQRVFTIPASAAGTKTVTELATAGWDLTALACSEGVENLATRTATLTVDPGDAITCRFTNTRRGSVSVAKTEGGSSALTRAWSFELSGNGIEPVTKTTADGNPVQFGNLRPGAYTLCEVDIPIAWHSSLEEPPYNGTRTEAGGTARVCISLDIAAGENESFAVDNTAPSTLVVKEGTQ